MCIECGCVARASARQDRSARHRAAQTLFSRLAARRARSLQEAIPTIKDEDAKRPNREHESLVGEQSRIVNRMKAALIRLGIRGFNPKLKKAAERLDGLRTPDGEPIPPNTLAELRRDMVRRRLVSDQIRQIEDARLERLKQASSDGPHAMVHLLARVTHAADRAPGRGRHKTPVGRNRFPHRRRHPETGAGYQSTINEGPQRPMTGDRHDQSSFSRRPWRVSRRRHHRSPRLRTEGLSQCYGAAGQK